MSEKPLLCVLGASGSGKSTICLELEQKYNLKQVPSYTIRKPHIENKSGHIFLSVEELRYIEKELIDYAETIGAKYGITCKQIDSEEYDLYVVDFTGLKYLLDNYKGKRKIVSVFIECPLSDRYERLNKRYAKQFETFKEANQKTLERIVHDAGEFNLAKVFCDYVIDNHTGNYANAMMKIIKICIDNGIIQSKEFSYAICI